MTSDLALACLFRRGPRADAGLRPGGALESSALGRAPRLGGLAALGTLVAASLAGAPGAWAAGPNNYPITQEQRDVAEKTASSGVPLSELAPDAPSSYTIKRGDTLWSIASLFLKSPWRWPELWGMNRTQIQNPHRIYPGQTLGLVKTANGRAQLVLNGTPTPPAPAAAPPPAPAPAPAEPVVPTVRLTPRARELGASGELAISSIPNNLIEPYLSRPMVLPSEDMEQYGRIISTQQDRVNLGLNDVAFARGLADPKIENYNVLRPAEPLYDPEDTAHRHPIAYESLYLGTARVIKPGEVSTLEITSNQLEIGVGDRLVPITHQELINYAPHRPDKEITGRIVSVYSGLASVGAGSIVTVNRGKGDGLEIGHVLAVLRNGNSIVDRTTSDHVRVRLPDDYVGTLFVFRVFDNISYGLLVSATGPIQVGDWVGPPDRPVAAAQASTR